jgi:hypothetical protein
MGGCQKNEVMMILAESPTKKSNHATQRGNSQAHSEPQPEGCESAVGDRSNIYGDFLARRNLKIAALKVPMYAVESPGSRERLRVLLWNSFVVTQIYH